ncbi:MAG: 30S ribosomal protein S8 [Candidatus Pacearchaeota archaeon]|nr:30S ribosomal protein S8 [Candidatus Pacearchaeota archaeon]
MSQDVVSDALNNIMNANRAGKKYLEIKRYSKLLLSILAMAKMKGYITNYEVKDNILKIEIGKLNFCKAIKPRFVVRVDEIEKYVKRYLPAKDIGTIIISTPKGLMSHTTCFEKNIGGCLLAYFY